MIHIKNIILLKKNKTNKIKIKNANNISYEDEKVENIEKTYLSTEPISIKEPKISE